jgi:hypothetical protein
MIFSQHHEADSAMNPQRSVGSGLSSNALGGADLPARAGRYRLREIRREADRAVEIEPGFWRQSPENGNLQIHARDIRGFGAEPAEIGVGD